MSGRIRTKPNDNLEVQTAADNRTIRLNSRNYDQATGDSIGFQARPAQNTTSTGTVQGCQISPRVNSGVALDTIIGAHIDAYLKGTAAGTLSGDVRGLQIELVTDDAGTRDIGGNVSAIRIRAAFSAGTVTGKIAAIRVEKMESQTNSKQWDAVLELPSTCSGIWHDTDTGTGDTEAGYIKVLVNGNARYIALYSDAPGA